MNYQPFVEYNRIVCHFIELYCIFECCSSRWAYKGSTENTYHYNDALVYVQLQDYNGCYNGGGVDCPPLII